MSELKWNWVYYPYLDAPNEQEESALKAGYIKVVDKSEADKVIAELKDKLDLYKRGWEENDKVNENLYAQLRHHKYKRCLTMAQEWRSYATFCGIQSSWHNNRGFGKTAEKYTWKECHAWKCVKRWLELAEKFKEAK